MTSTPAASKGLDQNVEGIVEQAALLSKAHALIERTKRNSDPSGVPSALEEFQAGIQRFIDDFKIRCVLEILGRDEPGIEIRTTQSESNHTDLVNIVRDCFANDFDVVVSAAKAYTGDNDPAKVPIMSISLGSDERRLRRDMVVLRIADAVNLLNGKLGYLQTDERASDVLD